MRLPPAGFDDRVGPLRPRDQQDAVVVHVVGRRSGCRSPRTPGRASGSPSRIAGRVDRVHAHVGQRPTAGERPLGEPSRRTPAGVHSVPPRLDDLAQLTGLDPRTHRLHVGVEPPAMRHHQRRRAGRARRSIIASHSATEVAIGFSTRTCVPASSSAIDCGACNALGVATTAASIVGIARQGLPVGRDPRDAVALGERASPTPPGGWRPRRPRGRTRAPRERGSPGSIRSRTAPPASAHPPVRSSVSTPRVFHGARAGVGAHGDAARSYSFEPVSVTPSTKTRWARKNRTITGIMNMTDAAMMRLYSTWC